MKVRMEVFREVGFPLNAALGVVLKIDGTPYFLGAAIVLKGNGSCVETIFVT